MSDPQTPSGEAAALGGPAGTAPHAASGTPLEPVLEEGPGSSTAAAPPSGFRLRPPPPRVMRLSPKALALLALLAGSGLGGALVYGLKVGRKPVAHELYNTDGRTTAEALASAPKDYSQVPKLGAPLPGDLGRPILSAQQRGGETAPATMGPSSPSPQATAAEAARQRTLQERDAALTSRLFQSNEAGAAAPAGLSASSTGASEPPTSILAGNPAASAPSADASQNGQADKQAFLAKAIDRRSASDDRLTTPASPYVVQAGSIIAAALITGIRSDLPGQVTAQVTENVYDSPTGHILLIPQGARLIGEYDSQVSFGQSRVLLAWTRLILPDGRSILLERQPGADTAGYAGLEDGVDNHWGKLFKAAILSTLLSVGSEAGTSQDENNLAQAIRSGASTSFSQTGQQIVAHELNIQPTLTIRPGFPVRVLVTRDLALSPYG